MLVASADAGMRDQLISGLANYCWPVVAALGGADALGKLESTECDVLLLDQQLPDLDCNELLGLVEKHYPGVEVLQFDSRTRNVIGTPRGWKDGLSDVSRALERITGISRDLQGMEAPIAPAKPCSTEPLPGMVGSSETIRRISSMVRLVAAQPKLRAVRCFRSPQKLKDTACSSL